MPASKKRKPLSNLQFENQQINSLEQQARAEYPGATRSANRGVRKTKRSPTRR